MENIKVLIGEVVSLDSRVGQDSTRTVEFLGEELAQCETFGTGRNGQPTDTRGRIETLYRAEDGRLVVHIRNWSKWQGEPDTYSLAEVSETDLGPDGDFWQLGHEAGFGRPLTLDEALATEE